MNPLIIEVPSPLGLRPSGVEAAPGALRKAGLHARLGSPDEARIDVPPYCDARDLETGVLNPQGIAAVARDLAAAVGAALDRDRFPIVLGGDCSIVLGPMLALRRRGRYGLVFIDGHADFQHAIDEPNGEVASLDLALVTGRGPEMLTDLDGLRPLVLDEDVALVGYRAFGDNDHVLEEHVRDTAITVIDYPEVRENGAASTLEKALAAVTRPGTEGFWVHLDVDVLDDELMPAVDYRHPGGLTWNEIAEILHGILRASGARGLEVTIFNPRLDAGGSLARRLSDIIASALPQSMAYGQPVNPGDRDRHAEGAGATPDRKGANLRPELALNGPADVTVRRAEPSDAEAMRRLARSAYHRYVSRMGQEPAPMTDDYAAIAERGHCWVAELSSRVVGLLVLQPAEDYLLLENVAVADEMRGTGVGSRLLHLAEEQARAASLPEIRLYTNEAMTENLDYYPRRGYRETHRATSNGYRRVFFSKTVSPH